MKKSRKITVILIFALSMAHAAFGQSPEKTEIPDEEYGIYTLAMEAVGGASSVNGETLNGEWKDYLLNFFEDPVKPGPDLVKDFNQKNKAPYPLSAAFIQASKKEPVRPLGDKRQARFSRPGLDLKKGQALLVVGLTYVYPEDVMNEGKFVLLGKKDGKWVVEKTIQAWDMRLGDI
jgi:hypothetical protein